MYKSKFGTKDQISFNSESEYYEFLGYLAKSEGTTSLVWEDNDLAGAWTKEGRIHFYSEPPATLGAEFTRTLGVNNILFRVNCNEFISNIRNEHNFILGRAQDSQAIRSTVPVEFQSDFDTGLNL
jgi:hypothetical protein